MNKKTFVFLLLIFISGLFMKFRQYKVEEVVGNTHCFTELVGTGGNFVTNAITANGDEIKVGYFVNAQYVESKEEIPSTKHINITFYDDRGIKMCSMVYCGSKDLYMIDGRLYKLISK